MLSLHFQFLHFLWEIEWIFSEDKCVQPSCEPKCLNIAFGFYDLCLWRSSSKFEFIRRKCISNISLYQSSTPCDIHILRTVQIMSLHIFAVLNWFSFGILIEICIYLSFFSYDSLLFFFLIPLYGKWIIFRLNFIIVAWMSRRLYYR